MTIADKLTVNIGVDFVRCSECKYKKAPSIRDNLLVTAGLRAAYMHDANIVELPEGIEGENELAEFIARVVDEYLIGVYGTFDIWIETALKHAYGKKA